MVLDTVIHEDQNSSLVKTQNNLTIGGPPSFAGIIGVILSKIYSWMFPQVVYAYTCPEAFSLLRKSPDYSLILKDLKIQPICPNFRLIYSTDKKERRLLLKNPPLQFNPKDFNWKFVNPPVAIIGSIFQEFNDNRIFSFLRKRCFYIAFDPQGCFRHLTSEGKIKFRNWWDPKIIGNVDCLQVSETEYKFLGFGKDPVKVVNKVLETPVTTVILTRGRNGAIIGFKGQKGIQVFDVPAFTGGKIDDETGAGDIFLFAFVNHFLVFQSELNAIAFATSVTSIFLEQRRSLERFSEDIIRVRQEKIKGKITESSR
jgi:sugar/nucleoside kinase (ribokinase family)